MRFSPLAFDAVSHYNPSTARQFVPSSAIDAERRRWVDLVTSSRQTAGQLKATDLVVGLLNENFQTSRSLEKGSLTPTDELDRHRKIVKKRKIASAYAISRLVSGLTIDHGLVIHTALGAPSDEARPYGRLVVDTEEGVDHHLLIARDVIGNPPFYVRETVQPSTDIWLRDIDAGLSVRMNIQPDSTGDVRVQPYLNRARVTELYQRSRPL